MERRIVSERLILRTPVASDAYTLAEGRNTPFVQRYNLYRRSTAEEMQRELQEADAVALELKSDGKVIGCISVKEDYLRYHIDSAEIVGWLIEEYASKGYMTEAIGAMISRLFEEEGYERVAARIFAPNIGASKAVEKVGFVYEGRLREAVKNYNGEVFDVLLYSIDKREYYASKNKN